MSRNQQQAVSDETRVARRDYEGERALRLRQFIANQPQLKQGKPETQYQAEVRKLKNKGAVAKNPNATIDEQGNIVPKYADTDVDGRVIDRQANTQRRMQGAVAGVASPFVGAAAVMGAGAAGASTIPYIAPALNAPILGTVGTQYGAGAITAQNLLGLGFGLKGASNLGGDVDSGYYSSDAPLSEKVDRGLITAMDMAFSPGVTKALGMGYGAAKNALIKSTEEGLLSNTYKINPFAEKLNNPNKSYRVAGLDAFEDFKNTGVLRSVQQGVPEGASLIERAMSRPTAFPSFQKGYADMKYASPEGAVVFETGLPTIKRGEINPVTGFPIKGRHYAHRVIDPKTGATLTEIPADNIKVFGDKTKPNHIKSQKNR
jgi:hypothetical protein